MSCKLIFFRLMKLIYKTSIPEIKLWRNVSFSLPFHEMKFHTNSSLFAQNVGLKFGTFRDSFSGHLRLCCNCVRQYVICKNEGNYSLTIYFFFRNSRDSYITIFFLSYYMVYHRKITIRFSFNEHFYFWIYLMMCINQVDQVLICSSVVSIQTL